MPVECDESWFNDAGQSCAGAGAVPARASPALDACPACLREWRRNRADAYFGGHPAVQSLLRASIAKGEGTGARLSRRPAILAAGLAGAAVLAITAVAALPSVVPSGRATAARPSIKSQSSAFVAKAVDQIQQAASESDPGSRRFSGRVGDDLSQSLAAAGVPEIQGREYVALLSRAIKLQDGLSVDDRFDLVLEREPDGSLGQLLYAGMDRCNMGRSQLGVEYTGRSEVSQRQPENPASQGRGRFWSRGVHHSGPSR